jgi:hypothetical protein
MWDNAAMESFFLELYQNDLSDAASIWSSFRQVGHQWRGGMS